MMEGITSHDCLQYSPDPSVGFGRGFVRSPVNIVTLSHSIGLPLHDRAL